MVIAQLEAPDLDHEIERTRLRSAQIEARIARRSADPQDRADTLILFDQLASLRERRNGLERERQQLSITAPVTGEIVELDPDLHPGRWVTRTDLLARVINTDELTIKAYASEIDLLRIDLTEPAKFISDAPQGPPRSAWLDAVSTTSANTIDILELSSYFGGAIPVRLQARERDGRQHIPSAAHFLVTGRAVADGGAHHLRVERGVMIAAARAESLAVRALRQVLKVLIRESGV